MIVIKYPSYVVVTDDNGTYVLVTYANRPFRELVIGTIDYPEARRLALDELKPLELEDRDYIGDGLSGMMGNVGKFLQMKEAMSLREINMTSLKTSEYELQGRYDEPTLWNKSNTGDVEVHWEYNKNHPTRVNGILWMNINGDSVMHMYVLMEGRGILYIMYSESKLMHIFDLTAKPDMNGVHTNLSYDSTGGKLLLGDQVIQYNPDKKNVVVDGYKIYYSGFQGNGHYQFTDIGYTNRKVYLVPERGWWKYVIFYDPKITAITSLLKK